jgi:excinuclease ABC subunit C
MNKGSLISSAPEKCGVYLMKDIKGDVIYIGKAVNLKNRIRGYFQKEKFLIKNFIEKVENIEYIITNSESEALLLENNLIKKYRPKYNVKLRDDKTYPYIKITLNEEYPRIFITRRISLDGAKYFGPYASAGSVRKTLKLIKQIFSIATCKNKIRKRKNPCLEFHINRCVAPCIGNVKKEEYQEIVKEVINFLNGKQKGIIKDLEKEMKEAAENLNFEKAKNLRDKIRAIEKIAEKQKVVIDDFSSFDVIGVAKIFEISSASLLIVRDGKLISTQYFLIDSPEAEEEEIISNFIKQIYFSSLSNIPPEIIIQKEIEEKEAIEKFLSENLQEKIKIFIPKKGVKKELLELAKKNAELYLTNNLQKRERKILLLKELQDFLNLKSPPLRIECYDISSISGTEAVGSLVVFENGVPLKSNYRRFKIKTVDHSDDYAMLKEVIRRRFTDEKLLPPNFKLPDLVVIDGGKGHLNVVSNTLAELNKEFPIISIAKGEKDKIFKKDRENILLPTHLLHLIQQIRDEAHRFALSYHRKLREKKLSL